MGLAACDKPAPVLIAPPADLATCADEPAAPDLATRPSVEMLADFATYQAVQAERDLATLDYILSLRSAFGDCRAKVDGLARWIDENG